MAVSVVAVVAAAVAVAVPPPAVIKGDKKSDIYRVTTALLHNQDISRPFQASLFSFGSLSLLIVASDPDSSFLVVKFRI